MTVPEGIAKAPCRLRDILTSCLNRPCMNYQTVAAQGWGANTSDKLFQRSKTALRVLAHVHSGLKSFCLLACMTCQGARDVHLCEGALPDLMRPPPSCCFSYQPVPLCFTAGASSLACLPTREQQQRGGVMLSMGYALLDMLNEGMCLAWYL